jgi:hypothetical protein
MRKRFKSDYVSIFNQDQNNNQGLPSGYPCSFDTDCASPGVCQFNVCTVNIEQTTDELADICHGLSIKDCAKAMQKEREQTNVPIYTPTPTPTTIKCNYDKECGRNQVCISSSCIDKSNFPLIARQMRMKSPRNNNMFFKQSNPEVQTQKLQNDFDIKKFFEHKNTPLDGTLSPYEYMFLLENNNKMDNSILQSVHDDYFYFKNT